VALVVLVAALLIGVAAALLSGTPPTPPNVPSTTGTFVQYSDLVVFGYVIIGSVVVWIAYRFIQRIRDPSGARMLSPLATVWVSMFLVFLGFLVIVRFLLHPAASGSGRGVPANNSTGMPPPPPPGSGTSGNFTIGPVSAPGWEGYVVVVVVAVLLAAVAIPLSGYLMARRREDRESHPSGPTALERSRAEIAATLSALESDPNADPRALVEALYGRLLSSIDDRVGGVEARTAREIERQAVGTLGLPPTAARDLTALFEEARYSPHPITSAEVGRARQALQRILKQIDAGGTRP
ncbi:MAG: DUF4129 domain-containing protein, partial [Thermoplasmata archaeon]|nr:DUF4129 domain-containing protein [Thermoplasmata archaeon]